MKKKTFNLISSLAVFAVMVCVFVGAVSLDSEMGFAQNINESQEIVAETVTIPDPVEPEIKVAEIAEKAAIVTPLGVTELVVPIVG